MEITVLEKTEDTLRLHIKGIRPGLMNALRRIIIAETPVMAIDEVVILENQSPLFDEIIAHRLGMVPLRTNPETYVLPEECTCGGVGCHLCQAGFTMEVEAPEDDYIATTADLKPQDPETVPVSGKIPIAKLAKGQRIVVEAYARMGKGLDHAKWQPVSTVAYKMEPHVEVDPEKCDGCKDCVKVCFKHVFEMQNEKATVVKEEACTLCNLCVETCAVQAISVTYDETSFLLTLESTGSMAPEVIFERGMDVFKKKLEALVEELPKPKRKTPKKAKPKAKPKTTTKKKAAPSKSKSKAKKTRG